MMPADRFEIDADRFESFQGSHPETIGKCGFLAFADFADKAAVAVRNGREGMNRQNQPGSWTCTRVTNETECWSKSSTSLAKSASERVSRSTCSRLGVQSTFPIAMHYATRVFSSSTSTHQR